MLNHFDIYTAVRRLDSESFGVAVREVSACGLPVVISNAGGLPEVVIEGKTGLVVERENPEATACAMEKPALTNLTGWIGSLVKEYEVGLCVKPANTEDLVKKDSLTES